MGINSVLGQQRRHVVKSSEQKTQYKQYFMMNITAWIFFFLY